MDKGLSVFEESKSTAPGTSSTFGKLELDTSQGEYFPLDCLTYVCTPFASSETNQEIYATLHALVMASPLGSLVEGLCSQERQQKVCLPWHHNQPYQDQAYIQALSAALYSLFKQTGYCKNWLLQVSRCTGPCCQGLNEPQNTKRLITLWLKGRQGNCEEQLATRKDSSSDV